MYIYNGSLQHYSLKDGKWRYIVIVMSTPLCSKKIKELSE